MFGFCFELAASRESSPFTTWVWMGHSGVNGASCFPMRRVHRDGLDGSSLRYLARPKNGHLSQGPFTEGEVPASRVVADESS